MEVFRPPLLYRIAEMAMFPFAVKLARHAGVPQTLLLVIAVVFFVSFPFRLNRTAQTQFQRIEGKTEERK